MSQNPNIAVLEANRFMRSPDETVAFEQALTELAQNSDPGDLPKLHLILEDACQQPEVMFSLVHFLESFSLQAQLQAFIQVLPSLVKHAAGWTAILHTRIINDAEAQAAFEMMLQSMNSHNREEIHQILASVSTKLSSDPQTSVA
jgi:Immunity protein 30